MSRKKEIEKKKESETVSRSSQQNGPEISGVHTPQRRVPDLFLLDPTERPDEKSPKTKASSQVRMSARLRLGWLSFLFGSFFLPRFSSLTKRTR